MPGQTLYWTLVFTPPSLEHLAERGFDHECIWASVFGDHGPVFVRRVGSGKSERWVLVAPLDDARLATFVFRRAGPSDLELPGAFVVPPEGIPEQPAGFDASMRLCVSSRIADDDETRSYKRWLGKKGGRS